MIGIIGGGQLGMMLAEAASALGETCCFIDPAPTAPARKATQQIVAPFSDEPTLRKLAEECSFITFEFENVDLEPVERCIPAAKLRPPASALRIGQDRLLEKQLFERCGLAVPQYRTLDGKAADASRMLRSIVEEMADTVVIKTRRMGYDGKGQVVLRDQSSIDAALQALGLVPLLAERYVPFTRELSIIFTRSAHGRLVFYPLVQNVHRQGILRLSVAPAPAVSAELASEARSIASRIAKELHYVGTCAIELFEGAGRLLGNELAPRVHNSGHWSIEGANVSQFENHIRAITDRELIEPQVTRVSAMVNIIGTVPELSSISDTLNLNVHLYGKAPRPGRKLGHLTLTAASYQELHQRLLRLQSVAPELLPDIKLEEILGGSESS